MAVTSLVVLETRRSNEYLSSKFGRWRRWRRDCRSCRHIHSHVYRVDGGNDNSGRRGIGGRGSGAGSFRTAGEHARVISAGGNRNGERGRNCASGRNAYGNSRRFAEREPTRGRRSERVGRLLYSITASPPSGGCSRGIRISGASQRHSQ